MPTVFMKSTPLYTEQGRGERKKKKKTRGGDFLCEVPAVLALMKEGKKKKLKKAKLKSRKKNKIIYMRTEIIHKQISH